MNIWVAVAIIVATGGVAWMSGYSQGLKDAPERVELKRELAAQRDQRFQEYLAQYEGSRDQVCDRIFEMVEAELVVELYNEEAERN